MYSVFKTLANGLISKNTKEKKENYLIQLKFSLLDRSIIQVVFSVDIFVFCIISSYRSTLVSSFMLRGFNSHFNCKRIWWITKKGIRKQQNPYFSFPVFVNCKEHVSCFDYGAFKPSYEVRRTQCFFFFFFAFNLSIYYFMLMCTVHIYF